VPHGRGADRRHLRPVPGPSTLKGIADATGGRYFSAQDESQLKSVYSELARERQTEDKETELTYAVTGVALVLSVIAGGFSLLWFNRLP